MPPMLRIIVSKGLYLVWFKASRPDPISVKIKLIPIKETMITRDRLLCIFWYDPAIVKYKFNYIILYNRREHLKCYIKLNLPS